MKTLVLATFVALSGSAAQAIVVDGSYDAAYGAATATVSYNASAPNSNFGAPTGESAYIAYSIYLSSQNGYVYTYLRADPSSGGASAGAFNNLYFDIDPANGNGSDVGFELSAATQNVFVPGLSGPVAASGITVAASGDGLGLEAAIPISYFTDAYPGLTYYGGQQFATVGSLVRLRLSQSFGYSVNGGPTYGDNRLGAVTLLGAGNVPEPASWALMIAGFAMTGFAARRRTRAVTA